MRKTNTAATSFRRLLTNPLGQGWWSVLGLVVIDLIVACSIPPTILSDVPILAYFVLLTKKIAPIIDKFDARNAVHPEVVQLYLALSVWLLIPKTIALYCWLNKSRNTSLGAQLIISPLTSNKAPSVESYVMEPLKNQGTESKLEKQRSWLSKIIWSLLLFGFAGAMIYIFTVGGSPNSRNSSIRESFVALGHGGPEMWFVRSLKDATFLAFLLSVAANSARGYLIFFKQLLNKYLFRRS